MADKIHTGESSRDILGKGAIINPNHGGPLRRPTETSVIRRDVAGSDKTSVRRRIWIDGETNKHYSINDKEVTEEEFFGGLEGDRVETNPQDVS